MAQGRSPHQRFSRRRQEVQGAAPDGKNGLFFRAGGGTFLVKGQVVNILGFAVQEAKLRILCARLYHNHLHM